MSDNKTFWKTAKSFFTDKDETISDNDEISEKLNSFFLDIVKNLNISQYDDHLVNTNTDT